MSREWPAREDSIAIYVSTVGEMKFDWWIVEYCIFMWPYLKAILTSELYISRTKFKMYGEKVGRNSFMIRKTIQNYNNKYYSHQMVNNTSAQIKSRLHEKSKTPREVPKIITMKMKTFNIYSNIFKHWWYTAYWARNTILGTIYWLVDHFIKALKWSQVCCTVDHHSESQAWGLTAIVHLIIQRSSTQSSSAFLKDKIRTNFVHYCASL